MNAFKLLSIRATSALPLPTGPEAPAEVSAAVTKALNFGWFIASACCVGMMVWGFGSFAYASKKQNFGGVNDGKKTVVLSLTGLMGLGLIRALVAFVFGS